MAEKKLHICGVSEKARFLDELLEEYGEDIQLGELRVQYMTKCLSTPIEECRFTSIKGMYEFTGTIEEIVQNYGMSKKLSSKKIVKWLVEVLTKQDWIPDFNGVEGVAIKCAPIDRKVNQLEVETYLKELAKRELQ